MAKKANIMVLPGGGFDVVPSDCLAAYLNQNCQTASHFRLFLHGVEAEFHVGQRILWHREYASSGQNSQGWKDLMQVPPAWQVLEQDFGHGAVKVVSVGWGDVSPRRITAQGYPISKPTLHFRAL